MKIGLSLPQRYDDVPLVWAEMARLARFAEDGGAESLWVADHFLYRNENVEMGLHEAFTMLTAVAAVTTNVQVGPLVACTSFRSAGMLAKIAGTIDTVSGGRLILGLGCGWHEPEYTSFGYPFDHRVGRFEEVVKAVRGLLHGERVTVDGTWTRLDDAVLLPRPEHQVPMLIASEGPRMMSITARFADAWQCGWSGVPDDDYRRERAALDAPCEAAARSTPIEIFKGIDVNNEDDESGHIRIDASAIADTLAAWSELDIDHIQLRVDPGSQATFEVALEGIHRFRDM